MTDRYGPLDSRRLGTAGGGETKRKRRPDRSTEPLDRFKSALEILFHNATTLESISPAPSQLYQEKTRYNQVKPGKKEMKFGSTTETG